MALSDSLSDNFSEFGHDGAGNLYYANMIKCDRVDSLDRAPDNDKMTAISA